MDGRHAKWAQNCQDAIRADLNDPASADFPSPVVDAGSFVHMQVADAEKGGDPFKMAPAAMLAWTDKHPELSSETVSFKFHAKNLMGGVQRYTAFCTFTDNFDGTTRMTQQAAGLGRRDVADGLEQLAMVEPVEPFERGVFDGFEAAPGPAPVDHLGLVRTVDRLGQSVVVAIADATDRRLDPGFGEALGVLDEHLLRPAVAMMDEGAPMRRPSILKRLFQGVEDETGMRRPAGSPADDPLGVGIEDEGDVDEPRPGRDVEPAPAKGGVKSDTESIFGAGA